MINENDSAFIEYIKALQYLEDSLGMSEWEIDFLQSVSKYAAEGLMTNKQRQKILSLVEKYEL